MEITSVGDSALIVRVRDRFEDAPEETLKEVLDVFRRLENARIPGVIELAPAYTTVAVFFDPVRGINNSGGPNRASEFLTQKIHGALPRGKCKQNKQDAASPIEIPVCY